MSTRVKKKPTKKAAAPRVRRAAVEPKIKPPFPTLLPADVRIVASCIAKGGSGKTTISVHLAHYLAKLGEKVLMVDCDPQGNASQVFLDDGYEGAGVSGLFSAKGKTLEPIESNTANVWLLPADRALEQLDGLRKKEEFLFRDNLRAIASRIGARYVVIDTPPTLISPLALAPLVAANFVFSPIKPDAYGLRGVANLLDRIEQVRAGHNPDLLYLGLLVNLWNRRNRELTEGVATLESQLSDFLVPFKIGESAAIARVANLRLPVWSHNTGAARAASKEMIAALAWIVSKMEQA